VYDGDTFRANVDLGFGFLVQHSVMSFRLFGLDAPELHGDSREMGLESRDALRDLIEAETITIESIKDARGKYGRWLATVYKGQVNVNQWMIDNGFAVPKTY